MAFLPSSGPTMSLVAAWVLLAVAVGALLFFGVGLLCTRKHVRLPVPEVEGTLPPISLLKPVKGAEEALVANLTSVFVQDYPAPFEIVFSATDPRDPALAVARQLAAAHPAVPVRFVISDESFGLNPKVANLAGALHAATHDLVLSSDANVRMRPDYVRRVVSEYVAKDASLLTSMVVGTGERSAGAALENLQLTAFIAPAMATALHLANINCVVGKSMLLRRSELAEVGGLELVRDILAEDFILGREYQKRGKKVVLSATTIENVNEHIPVSRFLERHSRWLKMRVVIHLGGFFGDLGANPVALGLLALALSGFDPRFAAAWGATVALKAMGDFTAIRMLRARPMKLRHLALAPLRDTLMGAVWFYSIFSRSVSWRGKKLRFGKDSRLRPDEGALPVRFARRVLAPFRA